MLKKGELDMGPAKGELPREFTNYHRHLQISGATSSSEPLEEANNIKIQLLVFNKQFNKSIEKNSHK